MFNRKSFTSWLCLLVINALPFVLNICFYHTGSMDDLVLFLPVFVLLTLLNFRTCKEAKYFVFVQGFMLVCIMISNVISTELYYHLISDDAMTPVVGKLFLYLEAGICLMTSIIVTLIISKNKPRKS